VLSIIPATAQTKGPQRGANYAEGVANAILHVGFDFA